MPVFSIPTHWVYLSCISLTISIGRRLCASKIDGTYVKQRSRLERNALLILDDFGLQPLKSDTRLALLQILEDRYKKKSRIIASQLPIDKWYEYIGDPTLADAIMDRLIYNAYKIELKGPSMRERGAKTQAKRAKKARAVLNKFNKIIKQIITFKKPFFTLVNLNRIGWSISPDYTTCDYVKLFVIHDANLQNYFC